MKKTFTFGVLALNILLLGACSHGSTTESSKPTTSTSSTTKKSSSVVESSTTDITSTSSTTTESLSVVESIAAEKKDAADEEFDALSSELKVVLMADIVDNRVQSYPGLDGLTLNYAIDNDDVYLQITSGAGSGHPIYQLKMSEQGVTPEQGVCYMGIDGNKLVEVNKVLVSKATLLQNYQSNKELYDSSINHVVLSSDLKNTFDTQLSTAS